MYQFERSSSNASKALITSTVRYESYAASASPIELVHTCEQPPVERSQFEAGHPFIEVLVARFEPLDRRVVDEEANRVPERE